MVNELNNYCCMTDDEKNTIIHNTMERVDGASWMSPENRERVRNEEFSRQIHSPFASHSLQRWAGQ